MIFDIIFFGDIMDLIIGSHVSFNSKTQLVGAVKEALEYNANTFMIYTGSAQSTLRAGLNEELTYEGYKLMIESGINPKNVIIHAPYILNFANRADEEKTKFNVEFFVNELNRVKELGFDKIVLHPGSAVNCTREEGINNIILGLNEVISKTKDTIILLEYMAGKGNELGINITELKTMYEGIEDKSRVAFCLDTCHMNDSGINISEFDAFLDEFDKEIGIDKIKCVHVNDSMNTCASHKDRHANLGYVTIGFDNLINVIYNQRLNGIPFILESPYVNRNTKDEYPPYKYEIDMIRKKEFIDFIQ